MLFLFVYLFALKVLSLFFPINSTCFEHKTSIQTDRESLSSQKGEQKRKRSILVAGKHSLFHPLQSNGVAQYPLNKLNVLFMLLRRKNVQRSIAEGTMAWSILSSSLHYDEKGKTTFMYEARYFIAFSGILYFVFKREMFYVLQVRGYENSWFERLCSTSVTNQILPEISNRVVEYFISEKRFWESISLGDACVLLRFKTFTMSIYIWAES